ncbi:hypothetical protein ARMGADRAFT_1012511 [Armillaria gallica]|uniref:Uncharacterized protein n=1 Tax=Armillaria gallica TaxID=47427 RepID=A0A2H3DQE6_ARMGA|nr:hypothetical protein ARMGADRAFT_1012511 [Armillaria gallica]
MTGRARSSASMTRYVDKVTYKIDCAWSTICNSCQVYTLEEAAEQFICALFEDIADIAT